MTLLGRFALAAASCLLIGNTAQASFHLMQIEQIIGGVNGDSTAQAIQLRMRSAGQSFVSSARLEVVDATGANPILLKDITTNVSNSSAGARILLTTSSFANYANIPLVSDFTLTNPIPMSYLAAGQLRFKDDGTTTYWSVSWGGAGFTGSTTGSAFNDADGNFGPPVAAALPSSSLQALLFTGSASALSTTNLANYALSASPATFVNNAGTSFALMTPTSSDFDGDGTVDGNDFLVWQRGGSPHPGANQDLQLWRQHFGGPPSLAAISDVPEPMTAYLLVSGMVLRALLHRRQRQLPG